MTLTRFSAAIAATLLAAPVLAADIVIEDAYARASNPMSGAAFMMIHNMGDTDDRLIAATSDVAARVELHTHKDLGDGVMKMIEVEEGFAIPAGGMHALARGADHVMFLGLNAAFEQGDTISVTLTFEQAGDMVVDIPVDLDRQDGHGMSQGKGMTHGN